MDSKQSAVPAKPGASAPPVGGRRIESWAFAALAALVFLAPLFFIPSAYFQQSAGKAYLIILAVLISGILYLFSRLQAKSFEWIRHPLWYAGVAFIILLVVSSITSGNFMMSFFGQGFEYTTAAFLIILLVAGRLSATLSSRDPRRPLVIYGAIIVSYILLVIFAVVKLWMPAALSLGIFTSSVSTPIGSWYDLGIVSAVIFILSSMFFTYFPFKKRSAMIVAGVLWFVSAFFLVLIDMPFIWFGLALVFLGIVLHRLVSNNRERPLWKRLSIAALVLFLAAAFFAWMPSVLVPVTNALGAGYTEIHLPWQMTLDIGTNTIESSPWFGPGPNSFAKEYLLYKPFSINNGAYWSAEFSAGSGFVPTLADSLGAISLVILCLFYVYFFRLGMRNLSRQGNDGLAPSYVAHSSFFAAAFLSYMALVYTPSYANLFLLAVMVGISLGSLVFSGKLTMASATFDRSKTGVFVRIAIIVLIILLGAGLLWYALKASAVGFFTKGEVLLSNASGATAGSTLAGAKADFEKASSIDPLGTYDLAIAQTDLASLNALVASISASGASAQTSADETKTATDLLADATSRSTMAVRRDSSDYHNYAALAQVYSASASLGISGAYDSAVSAYKDALKYNPYNPALYLALAQLVAGQKDYAGATQYIGSALQLKSNYTDAVYLLVQIQVTQGQTSNAITSAKFLVQLNPNDPTAYFELGLLQYDAADYTDAADSLGKAVSLSPTYANAQYFLGLSYAETGNVSGALAQFESLVASNPGNAGVASILANLKEGKAPFAVQASSASSSKSSSSKISAPPIKGGQ